MGVDCAVLQEKRALVYTSSAFISLGDKNLPVLGWEASKPFWQAAPNELYNKDYFKRREYPPFSLNKLQVVFECR